MESKDIGFTKAEFVAKTQFLLIRELGRTMGALLAWVKGSHIYLETTTSNHHNLSQERINLHFHLIATTPK